MQRLFLISSFVALAAVFLAGTVSAQESNPGADLYAYYCANCHGETATGDGPMAQFLTVRVPDLTRLSQRNGGVFPMLYVVHRLDGTRADLLHHSPMPDFGAQFYEENRGYGDELTAQLDLNGRILTITLYLEGLQKP